MSMEDLHQGHRELFRRLYEPALFEPRMIQWLKNVRYVTDLYSTRKKTLYRVFLLFASCATFSFACRVRCGDVFPHPEGGVEDRSAPYFARRLDLGSVLALLRFRTPACASAEGHNLDCP